MLRRVLVQYVYGSFAWVVFATVSVLNLLLGAALQAATAVFDPQRHTSRLVNRWLWGRAFFFLEPGYPLRKRGLQHLGKGPFILVCNHISAVDIPACMGLPIPLRVAAKDELFRVPLLGWYMSFSRQIPVDRGGDEATRDRALRDCLDALEHGISVLFFPEGTRSVDTRTLPFRRGAFRIAKDTGTPVVPLAIYGTQHMLAKRSLWPTRVYQPVVLEVLPPIDPATCPTARALSNRAHEAVSAAVDRLRAELEPRGWGYALPGRRPAQGSHEGWW